MDRSLTVRTPESIAFSYELAGVGSRFLAVAADFTIQVILVLLIFWGLTVGAASSSISPRTEGRLVTSIAFAIIAAVLFMIFFGYFILFEAFWNGQTPGKRLLGLRVVRDGGHSIDFAASAIRNLVRVAEAPFGFYVISALSAFLSKENKRLGDIAAGTIVVRDARPATLETIVAQSEAHAGRLQSITQQEYALIDRFVNRRASMDRYVRVDIALKLAARIRARVPAEWQRLDDEELLERVSGS